MSPSPKPNAPPQTSPGAQPAGVIPVPDLARIAADTQKSCRDPYGERLWLYICLAPMAGLLPSLWTLWRRPDATARERTAAKTALAIALFWSLGSVGSASLGTVAGEHTPAIAPLLAGSLFTSAYCLSCIWLMVRIWRRQSPRFGWISDLTDTIGR